MFKWIAQRWALNDPLPEKADLIAVISYAATPNRLTNPSQKVLQLAREVSVLYPTTPIGWSAASKKRLEKEIKASVFGRDFYAGQVSSTTDECEAIHNTMLARKKSTNIIVVVAEGSHSRRCKRVWEHFFPNSDIRVQSIPAWETTDKESPSWPQSRWQIWLTVNILVYPFYRFWPGIAWFAKHNFHQPGY